MNFFDTALTKQLRINYPIIQAPMAGGITSDELVATSSENGVLGMIGAGYMSAAELQHQIERIKKQTNQPFGVNVFVPEKHSVEEATLERTIKRLQPFYHTYDMEAAAIHISNYYAVQQQTYEAQLKAIFEAEVPVVSFTFGIPEKEVIQPFKDRGTTLIGTAETVNEALILEQNGMDMVVVQGSEAGGHRGGFHPQSKEQPIGLIALLPQVTNVLSIPVIAAGGIMNGHGLLAACALGAAGVQMGTAFLLTEESGAHPLHKNAIVTSKEYDTVLTKAFSGKLARGLNNTFIETLKAYEHELPPYPIMNKLTQPIRKAAAQEENKECMSLWSGQGGSFGKRQTVAQLIEATMKEATATISPLQQNEQS